MRIGDRHMRSSRNNLAFNALELLVVYLSPWRGPHRTANLASRDGWWVGLYRACPHLDPRSLSSVSTPKPASTEAAFYNAQGG